MNHHKIKQKVTRMAFQILEQHHNKSPLILAGINNNGHFFAQLLLDALHGIGREKIDYLRIQINPAQPDPNTISITPEKVPPNSHIIIVDDVANTGRTLFYACHPFLKYLPSSLEAAVLVDRKHKAFPIKVDYVGMSLATTLQEHIDVQFQEGQYSAQLL